MFNFFKRTKTKTTTKTTTTPTVHAYKVYYTSYGGKCVTRTHATSADEACRKVMGSTQYDARKYTHPNDGRDFSVTPLYVEYAILAEED